jgi:UDP-N-acetylglucosamine enolpyruvyl transferase
MEMLVALPIIIIMGDWLTQKQMKNFISIPNIGIKQKLNERFVVFNIDEYRTSSLHNKTEEKCENLYLVQTVTRASMLVISPMLRRWSH